MKFFLNFRWLVIFTFVGMVMGCGNKETTDQVESCIRVKVRPVKIADTNMDIKYSGTIQESGNIDLNFAVVGIVSQVFVNEGDHVKEGQLLAELDGDNYKSAWEMAVSKEKQAEDAYKRLKRMYDNNNLPQMKLVEVETNLQEAKSMAEIAKKNFSNCKLYATSDGIVGRRTIEPGMNAMPDVTVINIVNIDTVYARVSIPENEISSISPGDKATIDIPALGIDKYSGEVKEIGVLADPMAHTYKIKIAIPNPELKMKPGMVCNVSLLKKNVQPSLMIPHQSVVVDTDGRSFVYKVAASGETVEKKSVQTGTLLNEGIEVLSGLRAGDRIVVSGQYRLSDRSLICIVEEE